METLQIHEPKNHSLKAATDVDSGKSLLDADELEVDVAKECQRLCIPPLNLRRKNSLPRTLDAEAATIAAQPNALEKATKGESPNEISPQQRPLENGNTQTPEPKLEDTSDSPSEQVDKTTLTPEMESEPEQIASSSQPDDELEESDELDSELAIMESELESSQGSANGQATKGRSTTKTLMLPQYQQMTKIQALEHLLRENAGTILHLDYVIPALHGELTEAELKAEKGRMAQALHDGTKKELWDKVPGESGCYTIDLKLVEPDLAAKTEPAPVVSLPPKSPSKSNLLLSMLPAYENLKSIDAVDLVINENAGQILTPDLVVKALYGKLAGSKLTQAREIVGRALWRGAESKRWQHLPGQRGKYTLDLRLLESKDGKS